MLAFKTSAVVVAFGALAAAQSLSDLSQQCRSAVTAIQADAAASSCTNFSGLINILLTPANTTLIKPIDSFLRGFCGADACSNATIQAVAANISTNCQQDLTSAGISSGDITNVVALVQTFFPLAKEIACLADRDGPQFCVTELLTNVQDFVGVPLSLANLESALPTLGGTAGNPGSMEQLPKNITCTSCVQAAYVLLKDAFPNTVNSTDAKSEIVAQCGAEFEAATALPADVFVGTGTAAPQATQTGAASRFVAPAGLLALVGAAVAVLA